MSDDPKRHEPEDDIDLVDVWHYSTRNGKMVLVDSFQTRWTNLKPGEPLPKLEPPSKGSRKAS
jgi:hypothetical protein